MSTLSAGAAAGLVVALMVVATQDRPPQTFDLNSKPGGIAFAGTPTATAPIAVSR